MTHIYMLELIFYAGNQHGTTYAAYTQCPATPTTTAAATAQFKLQPQPLSAIFICCKSVTKARTIFGLLLGLDPFSLCADSATIRLAPTPAGASCFYNLMPV